MLQNKRIVLYDTLLKQVTTSEIVAILGHEIGHWKVIRDPLSLLFLGFFSPARARLVVAHHARLSSYAAVHLCFVRILFFAV